MRYESSFDDAIAAIDGVHNLKQLEVAIVQILGSYGLDHFIYQLIHLPSAAEGKLLPMLSCPAEWGARYVERGYRDVDPVVAAGALANLPVDWRTIDRRGLHARRVLEEAQDFGFGPLGLTFPVRGALGDYALFTVTSGTSDEAWERDKRLYMRDFQLIAYLVHGRVLEFECRPALASIKPLSPRERECLRWAALGKTNKAIARELKISERVVRAYFETSRQKLKCLNRSHVVSRALSLQFIQPYST